MLYSVLKCPLLAAGKLMTVLMQVIGAIGVVGGLAGIPLIMLNSDRVAREMAGGAPADLASVMTAIQGLMLMAVLGAGLLFFFARLLGFIIDTVGKGDPFVPDNADRLRTMAWLALAFQLLAIPIAALSAYIGLHVPAAALHVDPSISFNGVMMAIVLFILARVFRRGTQMREELEGTV